MKNIKKIKSAKKARIGLYSIGLKDYWNQFDGLKERLLQYGEFIESKLSEYGDVFNFGLVDDETSGRTAGEWLNEHNVDVVFCHSATYAKSSSVLLVHQICKSPVILLNLQPASRMNYTKTDTQEWLAHYGTGSISEIVNALNHAGIRCKIINGLLGLPETPKISVTDENTANRSEAIRAWKEISEWTRAATVKHTLQYSTFGFLGNSISGLLDMYSDFTMAHSQTGIHFEVLEMNDLERYINDVTLSDIEDKMEQVKDFFHICGTSDKDPIIRKLYNKRLELSCKVAVAQERIVKDYDLDALAYNYHGTGENEYEDIQNGIIVGHSLLTSAGIPCSGEGDLKTAIAMKICDTLDIGGSFSEIVAVDYDDKTIILGHDGPSHIKLSDGKPILRSNKIHHGRKGYGISVEANMKSGPITILGISQSGDGKMKMIISEAKVVKGQMMMIGNTQAHIKFNYDPIDYMDKWFAEAPTHHFAVSIGHNASLFVKVAELLNVDKVVI